MFANQITNTLQTTLDLNTQQYFTTTTTNQLKQNFKNHLPSCIVIGCKNGNGYSNQTVKYYQVPTININSNDSLSSIARQWYINTLREDLLDYVLSKSGPKTNDLSSIPLPHHVCIEHFDEESFLLTSNDSNSMNQQLMLLKEDAVPSLFEIEVFQKMIAHQEQIALNQQKQLIQFNHQQQQINNQLNGQSKQSSIQPSVPAKRARMDPDTRAALIQRVPKAVKRTSLLSMAMQPQPQQPTQHSKPCNQQAVASPQQIQQTVKAQKAVKHTMPRFLLNNNNLNQTQLDQMNSNLSDKQSQSKVPKAVKHTSANILLPPPIMQSTKRINKAVKHTGGGTNAYYQSLNKPISNQIQQQPVNQINLTETKQQTPVQQTQPVNKIPMTTTYVYKRVLQPPEIDLNLECEDEEIILISAPVTPEPPSPIKQPEEMFIEPETIVVMKKDDQSKPSSPISIKKADDSNLNEKKTKELDESKTKKSTLRNLVNEITKTDTKQQLTQTKNKLVELKQNNNKLKICQTKKQKKKRDSSSESELSDKETDFDDDEDDESDENEEDEYVEIEDDDYEESSIKKSFNNKRSSLLSKSLNNSTNYSTILAKFYARSHGTTNNETESSSKRAKYSTKTPRDLVVGNYPAKCNVCNLILDNNIELTSHICSHLESGGSNNTSNNSATDSNSYISPFDAVTTTCGVCDTTFPQPFDLIKHLDQKHMKQLNEYKCRICERQHSKLSDLIAHLNQTHVGQEMPYRCDACGFRTSFYADAIYHIKKEHKSTLRHFCPYCLKSLILPYNEKQGYVQCNLFYSHLITHFNKHENDILMPSKCKHCQKCILHVRYMKEHLCTDHTTNSSDTQTSNSSVKLRKTLTESNSNVKGTKNAPTTETIATNKKIENLKKEKQTNKTQPAATNKRTSSVSSTNSISLNLRKRRRSTQSEQESIDLEPSSNKQNVYEFDDESNDKMKLLNEIIKIEPEVNQTQPSQNGLKLKGRRTSNSLSRSLNTTKQTSSLITTKIEENLSKRTRLSFTKNDIDLAVLAGPPYKRKQKALKQTTIKKHLNGSNRSFRSDRTPSFDESMKAFMQTIPYNPPCKIATSPEVITTLLAGNIRFNHNKNKFKCVECGDTDLKTHFRNDYTCHQCRYNTNCSNSFEYHLHGHLVSKRVALWNKVIKTRTEEYRCPCGFYINSTIDNNFNANTGNKVAAHLLKCDFKFCQVLIDDEVENEKTLNEKIESIIINDSQNETIEIETTIQMVN